MKDKTDSSPSHGHCSEDRVERDVISSKTCDESYLVIQSFDCMRSIAEPDSKHDLLDGDSP